MRPCLLMLPGLDGSGDLFQPLRGLLDAHFDIVDCCCSAGHGSVPS